MFPEIHKPKGAIKRSSGLKEWRENVTADLINRLCPELHEGVILDRSVLISGPKQFAKTTTACRLVWEFVQLIESWDCTYNLIPVRSFKQVKPLFNEANYQIIAIDDARRYNNTLANEVINDFNEVRHIFEELQETGCIIIIWIIQDSYKVSKEVRDQLSVIILKALGIANFSRRDITELVGRALSFKVITLLGAWLDGVLDDNNLNFLSRSIIITHTWVGYSILKPSPVAEFRPYKKDTNPQGIRFLEPHESEDVQIIHEWSKLDVFEWHEPLYKILSKSTKWDKYAKAWKYLIINDLPVDELKTEKLTGKKSTVNRQMRNALLGRTKNNGQTKEKVHPVYSWIKHIRGEILFEQFVIDVCQKLELDIRPKPKIKVKEAGHPPRIYTDDLLICGPTESPKDNIIVNLKVGKGKNSYTWDGHYKTTFYATKVGYNAVLLYYDLETDLVLIFDEEIAQQRNCAVSGEEAKTSGMPLTKALETLRERLIPPQSPPPSALTLVSSTPRSDHYTLTSAGDSDSTKDSAKGKGFFGCGDKTLLENKEEKQID